MSKITKCSCKEFFDNADRKPLQLYCQHIICLLCCERQFRKIGYIVCPLCGNETCSRPAKLPTDISVVKELIKESLQVENSKNSIQFCQIHCKKFETFCQTDSCCLCIECLLLPDHKTHEIVTLQKATNLLLPVVKEFDVQRKYFIQKIKENILDLNQQLEKMRLYKEQHEKLVYK